jgi:hypothetical protein
MKMNLSAFLPIMATAAFWFSSVASACTVYEDMQTHLPFNTTNISNADRLLIADKVIAAKRWPDVEILAVIIAAAYTGERSIERLKQARGENVKAYLESLGIKDKNIYIKKLTYSDQMMSTGVDGKPIINQISIELTPLCEGEGGCARLCGDPHVTPHSRLIQ